MYACAGVRIRKAGCTTRIQESAYCYRQPERCFHVVPRGTDTEHVVGVGVFERVHRGADITRRRHGQLLGRRQGGAKHPSDPRQDRRVEGIDFDPHHILTTRRQSRDPVPAVLACVVGTQPHLVGPPPLDRIEAAARQPPPRSRSAKSASPTPASRPAPEPRRPRPPPPGPVHNPAAAPPACRRGARARSMNPRVASPAQRRCVGQERLAFLSLASVPLPNCTRSTDLRSSLQCPSLSRWTAHASIVITAVQPNLSAGRWPSLEPFAHT